MERTPGATRPCPTWWWWRRTPLTVSSTTAVQKQMKRFMTDDVSASR
jgi:hypothetical protein